MNLFLICVTVLVGVWMVCNADITININTHTSSGETPQASIEDIQEVYDKLEKEKEQAPSFTDVIDAINKEFGGINYGEN